MSSSAHAKSCGSEFVNGLISRANSLERSIARCDTVSKKFERKKATVQQFCTACGPMAWNMVYLERFASDYAVCLRQSSSGRKALSQLRRSRKDAKFVQTACGY
jgi:hypothetical protein